MVSTDPPYYDNIGYADLSDYFLCLDATILKGYLSEICSVPCWSLKAEELIATPYRHEGSKEKAKVFFENGMLSACRQIYNYSARDIPVTIYYAYKQSDTSRSIGRSSSGWETMYVNAIVRAGFSITGTWPMRTEILQNDLGLGTNALASSIVLVCRKRPEDAPQTTRRTLISQLRRELHPALKEASGKQHCSGGLGTGGHWSRDGCVFPIQQRFRGPMGPK
jgi:putative DNA methylase